MFSQNRVADYAERDALKADLAAHRAVVRAAKRLDEWSSKWNREFAMDEFRQLHEALAHPLVQQAREEKR